MTPPYLTIHLLGAPRVHRAGVPVKTERQKSLALLVYLAATRQLHTRPALATMLWPETRQARTYLRKSIAELRQLLDDKWLQVNVQATGFQPGSALWVDTHQFQQTIDLGTPTIGTSLSDTQADHLSTAVDLYQGDFLAGFTLPDAPEFDAWARPESERLRGLAERALAQLINHWRDQGDYAQAIVYAQRWLALDATQEAAHRQLMQLYAGSGKMAAALTQYEQCVAVLAEELAVPPAAETVALYEMIKVRQLPPMPHPSTPIDATPQPSREKLTLPPARNQQNAAIADGSRHLQLTGLSPLIGREHERVTLAHQLRQPEARWLTLTGTGGVGKTRLALQLLDDLRADFPDGSHLVALAPLNSPTMVLPAIAQALDVRTAPEETLTEALLLAL